MKFEEIELQLNNLQTIMKMLTNSL